MSVSRRTALQGLVAAGAAGSAAGCASSGLAVASTPDVTAALAAPDLPALAQESLLNQARAVDMMAEQKIDLVLCQDPVNLFYLTNHRVISNLLGMQGLAYGAFAPTGGARPTLITGSFSYYLGSDDAVIPEQVDLRLFSAPAQAELYGELTDAAAIAAASATPDYLTPTFDVAPMQDYERLRRANIAAATENIAASAESALLRVVRETPLPNKTIAVDSPLIVELLKRSGVDIHFVDASRLLKRVRLQKTPQEIAYARYAAAANAAAGQAAAKMVEKGASFQDLRRNFEIQCAQRSTAPVYILIDGNFSPLTDARIEPGRTFLIDCVSTFMGYHGDYGRTVCVGEPSRKMRSVVDALSSVWDQILPELKVGTRFSEISALGQKLFAQTKVDAGLILGPHAIGLRHTDEPGATEFGAFVKEDLVLEENMMISVDMPVLGSGLGGTAHLEDLVLIGKDGPELLNQTDDRFIVV